ncbi:phosphodiester glycosidase family protein [Ochrobactrum sp. Marseille-Q0166]|uniref:phosphodiester glycosidase family protein n=1 Tax=Ochrobactrum sp. Marseille-Q0166 TaxID=2761105 RepID=UPI0016566F0A|nr:phosphodiester glycosidase family protein [Ochrobactrum sp. Marseille-Q0166]MBC8717388.1 phosphodiester glycosidase family protein [Ochrobactrum sp. Marseille-Q0166]
MRFRKLSMALLVIGLSGLLIGMHSAQAKICDEQVFQDTKFIICTVKAKENLRLFWKGADGEPYRNFSKIADAVSGQGKSLSFAFNAGMYQVDFTPMGLYVEESQELVPADTKAPQRTSGPVPNFYKKPNGVFYFDNENAGILPTDTFLKNRPHARFATQSGPMLVNRNRLNPILIKGSTDRTRRSGVGVCTDETVRFAISEDAVNFYDFASLFRDALKCPNALFLDGGGGAGIFNPVMGKNDISWHGGYGPVVGFIE